MPNRAERRAQAKAGRRGVPSQHDQPRGRGRS
ncbi:tripartite tricarboxylate transporter TctB family protein, partial [Bifidobacterium longum]